MLTPHLLPRQALAPPRRLPGGRPMAPVEILLVEDDPDDAELMADALREGTLKPRVTRVDDGEEAMQYLRRQGGYAQAPTPDLILLDLHLPRKNGHEVLDDLKADVQLRCIPVVILTASENEQAIDLAWDKHANCCVSKPINQEQFALAVQRIEAFWLHTARLYRRQGT
jgi:CheY-like chemotaxis protein